MGGKNKKHMIYVILWLGAIVAANYTTAVFGPTISVVNSFLLIGLMLTTRDKLHLKWEDNKLKVKMGLLIATGGLLSYLTQPKTGAIATASIISFAVSETVDSVVFQYTKSVNKSNTASAFVDSLLFPVIAFGSFMPLIFIGQFLSKTFGGYAWQLVLKRKFWVVVPGLFLFNTASAADADIQTLKQDNAVLYTVENRVRNLAFAFVDLSKNSVYGETTVTPKIFTVNPTVQIEFGYPNIQTVGLFGADWNGLQLLYRTDKKLQITYAWCVVKGKLQFDGFIDLTKNSVISQPQMWYALDKSTALGGELEIFNDKVTPAVGLKIEF